MYEDILADTPIYKLIMQRGAEKVALQEVQNLREQTLQFVQTYFPDQLSAATIIITAIDDKRVLIDLPLKISKAQTLQEFQQVLIQAGKKKRA